MAGIYVHKIYGTCFQNVYCTTTYTHFYKMISLFPTTIYIIVWWLCVFRKLYFIILRFREKLLSFITSLLSFTSFFPCLFFLFPSENEFVQHNKFTFESLNQKFLPSIWRGWNAKKKLYTDCYTLHEYNTKELMKYEEWNITFCLDSTEWKIMTKYQPHQKKNVFSSFFPRNIMCRDNILNFTAMVSGESF